MIYLCIVMFIFLLPALLYITAWSALYTLMAIQYFTRKENNGNVPQRQHSQTTGE